MAADNTNIEIDFNYAEKNSIGSADDALALMAKSGINTVNTAEDYYQSNYNKFKWKHVTYEIGELYPYTSGYCDGLTILADKGSLRYLLTSEDEADKYISLTKDLERAYFGNSEWKTINITTDKVLDLNGYKINMSYNRNRKGDKDTNGHYPQSNDPDYHNATMFTISKGATLTIIDSSKWREGGHSGDGTFEGYTGANIFNFVRFNASQQRRYYGIAAASTDGRR